MKSAKIADNQNNERKDWLLMKISQDLARGTVKLQHSTVSSGPYARTMQIKSNVVVSRCMVWELPMWRATLSQITNLIFNSLSDFLDFSCK